MTARYDGYWTEAAQYLRQASGHVPTHRPRARSAATPYRHEVTLRIQGTAEQIRTRLPAGIARLEEPPTASSADSRTKHWSRVELRAERLDWLPAVLASLDLPCIIERPAELRDLVAALAERLLRSARRNPPRL